MHPLYVYVQPAQHREYVFCSAGLYGSSSWETLQMDVITELCDDLANPYVDIVYSTDEETIKVYDYPLLIWAVTGAKKYKMC